MDLRVRLLVWLSAFSLALLAVACLLVVSNLLEDVAEEIEASSHLADLMLAVGTAQAQGYEGVRRLVESGGLRHVSASLHRADVSLPPPPAPGGLAGWLTMRLSLDAGDAIEERRIALGDHVLVIRADPLSEVHEILRDASRMLGLFVIFSVATILAAWRTAHRALQPVRRLEEGLDRLAHGETRAAMPSFELQEFRRIASAIDRLAESLAQAQASEKRLGRRLMALQEFERRELARELHDEFGQSLTAISVSAAFIERHAGAAEPQVLVECSADIRSESAKMLEHVQGLLSRLRPHGLDDLGMLDALAELLDGWRQRAEGITLEAALPAQLPPLAPAAGLALYRTVQEALTNVLRHSGATRVQVSVALSDACVVLRVRDDGRGCDPATFARGGGGLLGMRERAAMAGGRLAIEAAAGRGVRIELRLPIGNGGVADDQNPVAR